MLFIHRQLLGETQSHTTRDNGHFMDGIRARQELSHQRMAGLMIGRVALLFIADDHAAALGAHHDLVFGQLEVDHIDFFFVIARRQQGRFVYEILQIGAGKTGCSTRQHGDVHVGCQRYLAGMDLENALTPFDIGSRDYNAAIKSSRPEQRRIQHVGSISCGDENDTLIRFESIHFDQQLVQGLLALVMAAAKTGAAMASHRVDFVDKNDARRVLFALNKQIAHARGADTHEHFNEVRTADAEERHTRLTGYGSRQQGFAGPGRTHEKTTFGNSPAEFGELFRIFQKRDDLLEIIFRLIHARHIAKSYAMLIFSEKLCPAFPEGHGFSTAHLHLTHKEDPYADEQQHRK